MILDLVQAALLLVCGVLAFLHSRRDAVALLSLHTAVLWLIPGRLVIRGMGAVGTPAIMVGLICCTWWLVSRALATRELSTGPQPVRIAVLWYGWWFMLTYAVAFLRPLSGVASRGADRAVIALIALTGVTLLAADGIDSIPRLERLLRRVVVFASIVAAIGIIQFSTDFDPVAYISVPGLQLNSEIIAEEARSLFDRPFSTTLHPIEFSVVCAMTLPLALHFAMNNDGTRGKLSVWAPVILLSAAIPTAVSRSGLLAVVTGLAVAALAWSPRRRLNVAIGGLLFAIAMRAAVPGLLGTLSSLILGAEDDPSIQGRLQDTIVVKRLLSESWVFGLGPGVLDPEEYFFLDNQLYGTALSSGLVGLVLLLFCIVVGVITATSRMRYSPPPLRNLGYAVAGAIAAAGVTMMTFDSLSFPVFAGYFFLLIGCAGCLWRLAGDPHDAVGRLRAAATRADQ